MGFDLTMFASVGLPVGISVLVLALSIWLTHRASMADRASLGGQIEGLRADLRALYGRIDRVGADLGGRIDALNADLGGRIDALNADLSRRIETQGRQIDTQGRRIDALNARVDTMNADLGRRIDAQGRRIDGLSGRIDRLHPVAAESSPSPAYAISAAPDIPESRPIGAASPSPAPGASTLRR